MKNLAKILFYENSDINSKPLEFSNPLDFIKFCNEHNIVYQLSDSSYYKDVEYIAHVMCPKGTNACMFVVEELTKTSRPLNEKPYLENKEKINNFMEFIRVMKNGAEIRGHGSLLGDCFWIVDERHKNAIVSFAKDSILYDSIKDKVDVQDRIVFYDLTRGLHDFNKEGNVQWEYILNEPVSESYTEIINHVMKKVVI